MKVELHCGDCLTILPMLADDSIDAIVSDPPAGIGFMGKDWDGSRGGRDQWVAWLSSVLAECLRVAKPGAHLLCWALPRTSHWTGTAIEDAGWIIENRIAHIFSTGFPKHKSHLKPAVEDWWLATKPGGKKWLGVDACRVGTESTIRKANGQRNGVAMNCSDDGSLNTPRINGHEAGRWPANLLLSHDPDCNGTCAEGCPIRLMGEQSGERKSGGYPPKGGQRTKAATYGEPTARGKAAFGHSSGTAARFFPNFEADPFIYQAKASRRDRNEGCDGMSQVVRPITSGHGLGPINTSKTGDGIRENKPTANYHPTVKSTPLMSWLCRLACPPSGVILDPFMGSGSTGKAAIQEGFDFIGIEADPAYHAIAQRRIAAAQPEPALF